MLPAITYKRTLDHRFEQIPNDEILKVFEAQLNLTGVDKIIREKEGILLFENRLFSSKPGGNWNRWIGIRRGKIAIIESQQKRVIHYSFDIRWILIPGFILSLGFLAATQLFAVFIYSFVALVGLNLVIALTAQSDNLTGIMNEILVKHPTGK